ncbi:MAG: DNA mismatch repair endonuclease MutL, partial [Chloroflexota bacterium]|nr:DNA mismatch repair endonuclease MutL [Chloroflexota bacterium]
MPVHLLNAETIGKIAAGEVVERPASVVKELLENALDAGAGRIEISVAEGGTALIQVADDGHGMTPDEVALAVQRHATSKLASFDDLARIRTLGFRGEALPSIGAVADLHIRTAQPGAQYGAVLVVRYGEIDGPRAVAAPVGTVVTARDLFGNVPARRKFLRQPSTETSYISRTVGAYAAAYPSVRFTWIADGRRAFATDGGGDEIAAAVGVFGPELAQAALPLPALDADIAVPGVAVSGWVSSPRLTRSHRAAMHFFVNGRLIHHRALGFALEEAFHSLLMVGRHPLALVRIELDPSLVDVNVHPTKAEVKFVDERAVCRAVQRAAHAALLRQPQDVLPEVRLTPPAPDTSWTQQIALGDAPETDQRGSDGQSTVPPTGEPLAPTPRSGVPVLRVLGQVGGTYIIAEGPSGMFLIDQHAAHERVLYEQIRAQMNVNGGSRQPLL